jgi:hypothetical protein
MIMGGYRLDSGWDFSLLHRFIYNIRDAFPQVGEHWYEFEFVFTLWLLLPITDGAAIIQEYMTKPLISRIPNKMAGTFKG